MINMGTHIAEERSAIYFLVGILSLTLASCITTMPETQTFIGNTASITEENTCDTTLEKGPANKSRFEGVRMTVNCDVNDNNSHNILWRRSSGLGKWQTISNNTNILYKPSSSYKIKFESDEQMYKFVIKNATFQRDSGIYECGYECTPGGNFIPLVSAKITVIRRPTCVIQALPSSQTDKWNEFEVVCSWEPGQEGDARFECSGSPKVNEAISLEDRIISRFESNDTTNVTCRFSYSSDASVTTTVPCTMKYGEIGVDPFMDEVAVGSTHSSVGGIRGSTTPLLPTVGDNPKYTTGITESSPVGSMVCTRKRLPSLDFSALNREFEVICTWTYSQVNYPYFQRINGEIIDADIKFSDQIITRVNSSVANISCSLSVNTNTSRINITISCMKESKPRLIRVDPFIGIVNIDSSIVYNCTFNQRGVKGRKTLSWKVSSDGNVSAINTGENDFHQNVDFFVHEHGIRKYLLVKCHIQSDYFIASNQSGYGVLRVVEGTTTEFHTQSTVPGDIYTSNSEVTLDVRTSQVSDIITTFNNKVTEAHSGYTTLPTPMFSNQHEDDQMVNQSIGEEGEEVITMNHITIADVQSQSDVALPNSHPNAGSKEQQLSTKKITDMITTLAIQTLPPTQNVTVKVLTSVLAVLTMVIVSIAILYLRNRLLPQRRQDGKPDDIEFSNIPHILHEESSQWYALSFKDKRVQQSPSDDLETLHHHDHSGETVNSALSTSIGMLTLQPSDFSNDHLYAEPGAAGTSEEPLRDIISRQQCTFTPLTDND